MSYFHLSVTSNLPEDNCFGRCFAHSQFKSVDFNSEWAKQLSSGKQIILVGGY